VGKIPADVVGQAASTAATATQNAATLSQSPQANWYDVWSQTGSGLSEHSTDPQYLATHLAPGVGLIDSRIRMAQAVGRGWERTDWGELKAGMSQQAGAIADQASQLWNGRLPDGQSMTTLQRVGAAFGLLGSIEQLVTMPFGAIPFPAFPAIRVMDQDIGLPHAHMHPPNLTPPNPVPVPLPSTGPIIPIPFVSGASKTLINMMPAARCGDMGLGVWCGGYFPMYEVFLGSANVWIEGNRAGRVGVDMTKHCIFSSPKPNDPPVGPMFGTTINCSPNVMIGGVPLPSLTSMAIGAAFKALFKGVGKLIGAARKKLGRGAPPRSGSTAARPTGPPPPPHGNVPAMHTPRAQNIAANFGPGDRIIVQSINAGEMRAITEITGRECAVAVDRNGKLVLIMGDADHVAYQMGDQALVHTHPPGSVAMPSTPGNSMAPNGGSDTANAAYNANHHGWDHPQAVVGPDGNVRYYDQNGVINNPNSAMVPIDNAGNINGVHRPGGNSNAPVSAVPPGMMTPGNPYRP
jgi:uncharacterized Zn-binding protein involved in type VI secretion